MQWGKWTVLSGGGDHAFLLTVLKLMHFILFLHPEFSLAYVAYPEAVSQLPCPPLWSILFFLMLCAMGIDTQFIMVETVVIALMDEFPHYLGKRRLWIIAVGCASSFLLGLPMVSSVSLHIPRTLTRYRIISKRHAPHFSFWWENSIMRTATYLKMLIAQHRGDRVVSWNTHLLCLATGHMPVTK